ncbi:MAG TPA: acyl carrier protein [Micromonosporaceae bacterium]
MNTTEADRLLRVCVHEVAPEADLTTLAPDTDLREALHLDSLDFLQVVELLSERTGQRIDEDDYPRLATMAGATAFLAQRQATSA